MTMETLTFDELLDVLGERELYETIDLFRNGKSSDYEKLMSFYEIYQKIGGYPAAVVSYAKEKNLEKCYAGRMTKKMAAENKLYFFRTTGNCVDFFVC